MPPPHDLPEDAGDVVKKDSIYADSAPVEYASGKKHLPNKYQALKKQAGKPLVDIKNLSNVSLVTYPRTSPLVLLQKEPLLSIKATMFLHEYGQPYTRSSSKVA